MDAQIVEREDAALLGIMARINPQEADYGDLWGNRYAPREAEIAALARGVGCYGLYYGSDQPGLVDFLAGKIVGPVVEVPEGLTLRDWPGGTYAQFRCTIATIGATWAAIYGQWLPGSDHVEDETRPAAEYYAPDSMGPEGAVLILVAVRPK